MFGISLELLFKKEYTINSEIEKVWQFLTNIEMITDCIPYLEDLHIESSSKNYNSNNNNILDVFYN